MTRRRVRPLGLRTVQGVGGLGLFPSKTADGRIHYNGNRRAERMKGSMRIGARIGIEWARGSVAAIRGGRIRASLSGHEELSVRMLRAKPPLIAVVVLLALGGVFAGCGGGDGRLFIPPEGRYNARILRDTWGVPHVFGKTDADAAYGLGFAQCEDDWTNMHEQMLVARCRAGASMGKQGARFDYLMQLFKVHEFIEERYETDLSADVRAVLEAYAEGVTHFAAVYPERMPRVELPVTGKDIVASFMLKAPFFYGLETQLTEIMAPERTREVSSKRLAHHLWWPDENPLSSSLPLGSNSFAVGPKRSADGYTRLAINSHQPWDGPVAWYEAHVHSEEGWNMAGGTFTSGPMIFSGHDEHKGWCHTINRPDLCDVYVLDINPDNENQYRFDGQWRDLERKVARIKVKLWGPFSWTFKRPCLWSVHGPAMRTKHGVYALSFAGYGELGAVEQWFRMNKAKNLDAFRAAMALCRIPSFNCVYADCEGNLFYAYNGRFPERDPGYDWRQYLPGDTSETLWKGILPFDRVPQVVNPPSGFVFSCNNTPFVTAGGDGNPDPEDFPEWMGIEDRQTNRMFRALETFGADESVTCEEFFAYKHDTEYSERSECVQRLQEILGVEAKGEPLVEEGLALLRGWNHRLDKETAAGPLAFLTCVKPRPRVAALDIETRPWIEDPGERLRDACAFLRKHYGRIDVPWSEFMRLRRGRHDVGLDGGPDTLRAIEGVPAEDGRFAGRAGDALYMIVEWDPEGNMQSQVLHQYGAAAVDPESPHYDDQVERFANHEMRPTLLTEDAVREHLALEYRPGIFADPWYRHAKNRHVELVKR